MGLRPKSRSDKSRKCMPHERLASSRPFHTPACLFRPQLSAVSLARAAWVNGGCFRSIGRNHFATGERRQAVWCECQLGTTTAKRRKVAASAARSRRSFPPSSRVRIPTNLPHCRRPTIRYPFISAVDSVIIRFHTPVNFRFRTRFVERLAADLEFEHLNRMRCGDREQPAGVIMAPPPPAEVEC